MHRTVIRAGALLALLTLLLVPPVLVWRISGVRLPSAAQLREAWTSGTLDANTALGVCAAAFTAVWAWLAGVALTEAVRATRGRALAGRARQIATPAALVRRLSRLAVTAGVSSLPVLSTSFATAAPARGEPARVIPAPRLDAPTPAVVRAHLATGRDTPYSIAADVLGDPIRRDEIVALNAGRSGPDGRAWSSGPFPAGMAVLLPVDDTVVPDAARTVVVAPGDSWWSLADDHLGDGARWRELHAANVGALQPFGWVVPADTTVLHPGWMIVVDVAAGGVVPDTVLRGSHEVQPGETLSEIVTDVYHPASDVEADVLVDAVFAANVGTTDPVGRALHDPDLIHPGMVLTMPRAEPTTAAPTVPPTTAPTTTGPTSTAPTTTAPTTTAPTTAAPTTAAPTTTAPTAAPTTAAPTTAAPTTTASSPQITAAAGPAPTRGEHASVTSPPDAAAAAPDWVVASGLAGATLLSTGLGAVVASRRNRRLRASRAGDQVAEADPRAARADQAVRASSDGVAAARLDLALRALAAQIGQSGSTARPHLVVRRNDGSIEVNLDQPRALSTPWVPAGEGSTAWLLPGDVPIADLVLAANVASPCPSLVTLGHDDAGELFVDLEAVGGLHVEGPAASVEAILRSIAVELSVTPLADLVHVVVTGLDMRGAHVSERLHDVEHPDEALALARSLSTSAAQDDTSTFLRRATAGHEPWEPTVFVAGPGVQLAGLDADPRLVVVGPPSGGGWYIGPDGDGWSLEPLGRRLVPGGLYEDDAASVAALLTDAGASLVADGAITSSVADPVVDVGSDHALLVRVLGTVDVVDRDGTPVAFDRPKALELVAWLAQHRAGASRTAARTALWNLDVSNATFSNVVSDARRALARRVPPPDGEEWLARTYGESLPLHPLVALDADLVAAALDRVRCEDDDTAIITLRRALERVRGVPYTGVHFLWPDAEALPAQLTLLATSIAQELARRCLALGDVDGVLAATSSGLAVLPGHEELVCLRMRALSAAGDRSAVRREFAGYERAVLADPWSGGELADPVVAVRNELLGSATP